MPGYTPPSPGGSDGPPSPYRESSSLFDCIKRQRFPESGFTLRRTQPEPAPGPSGVRFAPGHVSIPLPELPDEPPLPPIPPQSPGSAYSSSSEHSSPRGGVHLPGELEASSFVRLSRCCWPDGSSHLRIRWKLIDNTLEWSVCCYRLFEADVVFYFTK